MKTYLRHKVLDVIDIKEIIALEYLDFEGRYKGYVEKHDFWELCYVEKGSVTLDAGKKKYDLAAKEVMLIAPNTIHAYFSESGNESKVFVICFASSSRLLKSLGELGIVLDGEQVDCLNRIINECRKTFFFDKNGTMKLAKEPLLGGVQAIIIQLEYLLICLLRNLSLKKDHEIVFFDEVRFYEEITEVVIKFFKANITRKLTLKEICARVNYSSSFLCKTFKEQTGQRLIEYFNILKIEEAKKLLANTEKSVADISFELGFSDVKYFRAIFKKHTEESPTDYRKNYRI